MAKQKALTWQPASSSSASPFSKKNWKKFDVLLRNSSNETYFEMKGVKAPPQWSQLAVDIAASKYFRKKGVKGSAGGRETSVQQLVERVSSNIEEFGVKCGYFATKADAKAFRMDLEAALYGQRGSFNSPVWFNAGLYQNYGITSKSRCFIWDFKKKAVVATEDAYQRPQISACFIQKVEDNLDSIFDLVKNEARIFKFGSGSGTNFSDLRGRNEQLAGGGTSSGVLSFLEVLDRSAASIKSGGTTRRAAKMVILDVDHPEIEDFIQWKVREEKKAKALIQAGYDPHFEGEAYRTVSGQNSNNSVRVTDKFMKAVEGNQDWHLRDRVTGKTLKTLKAVALWKQISTAAWACADPGLQFHDTINKWHTSSATAPIRASNPCSEYLFIDDSACNLASLNLLQFIDAEQNFLLANFRHAVRTFFLAQDILVDLASYPTSSIAQNSHDYRPLGLGFTGFGAFLMRKGLAYDSEEARAWGAALTALLTGYAYELSAELAKTQGAFAGWKKNKVPMAKVMDRHRKSLSTVTWSLLPKELKSAAAEVWQKNSKSAKSTGFRNAQATVIAPTGTISFIMDSETTGIEPEYALVRFKALAGGGTIRLTSPSVPESLRRLHYSDERINEILRWVETEGTLKNCSLIPENHRRIFLTALEMTPEAHVAMMSAVQPFVSGAISKTVNMPRTAGADEIAEIYMKAWKCGLKAVAIYRDQSKGFQPLTTEKAAVKSAASSAHEDLPLCFECGTRTELSGGCFRCPNCGANIGCS